MHKLWLTIAQKKDPTRVRITTRGNLRKGMYPGELTTRTASKFIRKSATSTLGARFACTDASNFYLATPLEHVQYMKVPVHLIPHEFIDLYQLKYKIKNGFVYCEIIRGITGLTEAGVLVNKLLKECLKLHNYIEVNHTPRMSKHLV